MKLHTAAYRQADFIEIPDNGTETLLIARAVVMIVFLTLLNLRGHHHADFMPLSILFGMMMFPAFGLAIS
ncbi:MAG: hypothetical protein ACLT38_10285 [Akkermansia sp.]